MTYLWTFGAAFLRLTVLSSLGAKQKQKKMQRFRGPLSEARLQGCGMQKIEGKELKEMLVQVVSAKSVTLYQKKISLVSI